MAEDERREKKHQWKRKLYHAHPAQEAGERDHQVSLGEQGKWVTVAAVPTNMHLTFRKSRCIRKCACQVVILMRGMNWYFLCGVSHPIIHVQPLPLGIMQGVALLQLILRQGFLQIFLELKYIFKYALFNLWHWVVVYPSFWVQHYICSSYYIRPLSKYQQYCIPRTQFRICTCSFRGSYMWRTVGLLWSAHVSTVQWCNLGLLPGLHHIYCKQSEAGGGKGLGTSIYMTLCIQ